jgi:hypothetical protein
MDNPMDEAESQEIMRIATDYARSVTDSEEAAQGMLRTLAGILQEQGAKLVHLGNVLFLILVRGKGLVEVHTIGEEKRPRDLAQNFVKLVLYLKNIGVKVAYTYTPDAKFTKLAQFANN